MVNNIISGLSTATTITSFMYAVVGCILGMTIGILPGLGPVATIALLIPITYHLPMESAIFMLAAIYYGAQYGGSITSILLNMPGEASSTMTAIDGYKMTLRGQASSALFVSAVGSFFAGCAGSIMVLFFSATLSKLAFSLGPLEYFLLILLGLTACVRVTSMSFSSAMGVLLVGLLIGTVGTNPITGFERLTFGSLALSDGVNFTIVAMGLFGVGEILDNLTSGILHTGIRSSTVNLMQRIKESYWKAILRGTVVGAFFGILPGGGAVVSSFAAHAVEKQIKNKDEKYLVGEGNIRGVAGPESANNAAAQTSFIPLLSLGIPPNASIALIFGAMAMHNIVPSPQLIDDHPTLFWGIIMSMFASNIILVIFNLPLIKIWLLFLRIPFSKIYPTILFLCLLGAYSIRNSAFDVYLLLLFGIVGALIKKAKIDPTLLIMGVVLGPILEENFVRTVAISRGNDAILANNPIAIVLLLIIAAILLAPLLTRTIRQHIEQKIKATVDLTDK